MTAREILNRALLADNVCFGCGHANPGGLHIEVWRDEQEPHTLRGLLRPPERMIGFPGITHGGAVFTALDCMAAWTATALRDEPAIWILRSARVTYRSPARQGEPVHLTGVLQPQEHAWAPVEVTVVAADAEGRVLTDGTLKVVPLSEDRFCEVAGVLELPRNWRQLLARKETG